MIYKVGGKTGQYDPALTRLPQPEPKRDRDTWGPFPGSAFQEGAGASSLNRILERVCAAVRVE